MSQHYDIYREKKSLPQLDQMLATDSPSKCGYSFKNYRTPKWCYPGCCLSNKCVVSEICERNHNLTWNKVPGNRKKAFKLDLATYKQGEACDWVVGAIGNGFKIFEASFVKNILSGKQLFIIGDSQARNMFVTLVSWIKNDYYFHQDFHVSGRYHATCPGMYDLMFNAKCVAMLGSKHRSRKRNGSDTNYYSYRSESLKIDYINPSEHLNEDKLAEIKGPDCYYILSRGVHCHYDPKSIIKQLRNFDSDSKGTFITPPWLSFAHKLKYKRSVIGQTGGVACHIFDFEKLYSPKIRKKM